MNRRLLITILLLSLVLPLAAQMDYRSRIAVIPLTNGTDRDQYNPLCSTITETVSLVLQFLKDYKLLDEGDADLTRLEDTGGTDLAALQAVAESEGINEVIFGRMEENEGTFRFSIALYNVNEGRVTNTQSVEAETVLDVFDAGDELTEGLIAQLSDITIAFGSISLVQTGGKGNYTVNLDGYPLRNPEKTFRKVLNGNYEVSVTQERLTGTQTVFSRKVEVVEGEDSLVEFEIPPGSSEEFEWMEENGTALLAFGEQDENFGSFMSKLTLFQNRTQALEYDAELEALRDNYMERAGVLASVALEKRMGDVDGSFYDKKVDFDETLTSYEEMSSLVKTSYEVTLLEGGDDLGISEPRKIQSDGGFKVVFNAFSSDGGSRLYLWNIADDSVLSRPLGGENNTAFAGDFYLSTRRLFLWKPGRTEIEILDHKLETRESLPVPGLSEGESGIKLALSPVDQIFLVSPGIIRVIDTAREYDESGELLLPDRYFSIEDNLKSILEDEDSSPGDIFFDSARHLNIFYPEAGNLYVFDMRGNLLRSLYLSESVAESHIAVDHSGFIYLTLYDQNSLVKYTPQGEPISSFGRYGTNPGEFSLPAGLALNKEGLLFVSDSYNGRIQSMTPMTTPVVYPEVARYSEDLDRRIDRNRIAVLKDKGAKEDIGWRNHRGNMLGTAISLGATFGFVLAGDFFGNNWANSVYNSTIDGSSDPEDDAKSDEFAQKSMDMLSFITFGAAAGYATTTVLGLGLDSTLTRYNRKQIQSLDMDKEYEINPDRYRSIRRTSRIGIWTGIVPPVLGALAFTAMTANEFDGVEMWAGYVVMGSIISPPIFSHLYAGRFSPGLLGAGLVADLLAVWGFMELTNSDDDNNMGGWYWSPDQYSIGNESTVNGSRAFERSSEFLGVYLLAAAFGVRIAAGIYDARNGWIYTNNYNRYKAVREVQRNAGTSSLDVNVLPYVHPHGGVGVAMNFSF